jgi:hypothetical protein
VRQQWPPTFDIATGVTDAKQQVGAVPSGYPTRIRGQRQAWVAIHTAVHDGRYSRVAASGWAVI